MACIVPSCRIATGKDSYYIPYIEKTAHLLLPPGLSVVSEFDAGELELGGKYKLQPADIADFIKAYPFRAIDEQFTELSHFNYFNTRHQIPHKDSSQLRYFSGSHKGNSWIFTLDQNTGELWIEIRYAEFHPEGPTA